MLYISLGLSSNVSVSLVSPLVCPAISLFLTIDISLSQNEHNGQVLQIWDAERISVCTNGSTNRVPFLSTHSYHDAEFLYHVERLEADWVI